MFADTQPNGELANACVTASCLAHGKKVWTGGDAHEWRHTDNAPCAGQRVEHSASCTCWDCQGDPFAGIPQADDDPFARATVIGPNAVLIAPGDLGAFLAEVNRRALELELATAAADRQVAAKLARRGEQLDLFDIQTTALVEPGMNGVLF